MNSSGYRMFGWYQIHHLYNGQNLKSQTDITANLKVLMMQWPYTSGGPTNRQKAYAAVVYKTVPQDFVLSPSRNRDPDDSYSNVVV